MSTGIIIKHLLCNDSFIILGKYFLRKLILKIQKTTVRKQTHFEQVLIGFQIKYGNNFCLINS